MTNWYDYNNQEMVSLPLVGEIVLTNAGEETFKVKILEHTFNGVSNIAVCRVIDDSINPNLGRLGYYQYFYPMDRNTYIEKKNLIRNVADYIYHSSDISRRDSHAIAHGLDNKGYLKFPEDK